MKTNFFVLAIPLIFAHSLLAQTETKLTQSDAGSGDYFGRSVSISGDRAIVGAFSDDGANTNAVGSAYVYRFNGLSWIQEQKLTASDPADGDEFGLSVSISGDRAVVGSFADDDTGEDSGSAYVYRVDGSGWTQEQKLTASDGTANAHFGVSVSISGDRVIVGAHESDNGSAYVYRFDGSSWTQEQKLTASDAAFEDLFGVSVSISGDRAIVGASADDDNGTFSGSAYVYRFDGFTWIEEQKLTASDAASDDEFGSSVSISGDWAIVGALLDDDAGDNSGSAYVYRFDGSSWVQVQKITAGDATAGDFFGVSVSVSGDRAIVGAVFDDEKGSAYVYRFDGSSWSQEHKLTASDGAFEDEFGASVSISGDRAIVGTFVHEFGAAYVYENLTAQACTNTDYTLSSQAEVDAFPRGCTEVQGELRIGSSNITDLSPLSAITSVGGGLYVMECGPTLTSLHGLSGITSVGGVTGGHLSIVENPALTSLDGLSALTSVGGDVEITNNTALTSLGNLSALTSVGDLRIRGNDALTSLEGLSGISSVRTALLIAYNAALTNLDGLSGITSVGGELAIFRNTALTNLDGLAGITSVPQRLRVTDNAALRDLDGLAGVTSVGNEVTIRGNTTLTNLDGLSGLTSVGGELRIDGNEALTDCSRGLYVLVGSGGVVGLITMNGNAASGDCNNDGADLVAVTARVQFVHASPDSGLSVVDVYFDDVLVFDDFSFASATPFMDVAAGQEIQIAVADSASASAANPIAMTAVTFQTGSTYHAIAAGFTDPSLFPPNPDGLDTSFRWYITNDARETSGSPGEFIARLFHALPDGITIDHYIVTPSPLLIRNDVAYGTFTGYDRDTPKLYTGKVTPADNPNQTLLTGVGDFSNAAGLAVQEVLIGFFGPRSSPDWPDLDWIFVYADGTVVSTPQTRTDVDDSPVGLPATFRLESNYPNPFNPSTTISYDLPRLAEATLTVYDVLGRTVRVLASGTKPPGTYEVSFDATGLPSGVYCYRLEAGDYVETKRMVIVR